MMPSMAMTSCRECRGSVSTEAKTCPHCGVVAPGGTPEYEKPPSKPRSSVSQGFGQSIGVAGGCLVMVVLAIVLFLYLILSSLPDGT